MRALLVLCLLSATAHMSFAQAPSEPPFRMEFVQNLGVSFDGPRNCWSVVNTGAGPQVAYVDSVGSMLVHRLVSWDTTTPPQLAVRDGGLFVTHRGRSYQFAQQVRYEQRLMVAPVTRYYRGLIFEWPHTQQELVQVPVAVMGSQWLEVPSPASSSSREVSPRVAPSSGAPARQKVLTDTSRMT